MNSRAASIIVGIFIVILVVGLVLSQNASVAPIPTSTTGTADNATSTIDSGAAATGTTGSPAATSGITSAEVATHNSRISCWSIINGNVYDLTSWIPQHPGGEDNILKLCGTDGSANFNGKHGGAPKQAGILSGFKIGTAAP